LSGHVVSDSWVSFSNLHGPEILGIVGQGISSHFGDKNWFGMWNGFSFSPGNPTAFSLVMF